MFRGAPAADDYTEALPRARRWTPRRETADVDAQIVHYRRTLDDLSVQYVRVWQIVIVFIYFIFLSYIHVVYVLDTLVLTLICLKMAGHFRPLLRPPTAERHPSCYFLHRLPTVHEHHRAIPSGPCRATVWFAADHSISAHRSNPRQPRKNWQAIYCGVSFHRSTLGWVRKPRLSA